MALRLSTIPLFKRITKPEITLNPKNKAVISTGTHASLGSPLYKPAKRNSTNNSSKEIIPRNGGCP